MVRWTCFQSAQKAQKEEEEVRGSNDFGGKPTRPPEGSVGRAGGKEEVVRVELAEWYS